MKNFIARFYFCLILFLTLLIGRTDGQSLTKSLSELPFPVNSLRNSITYPTGVTTLEMYPGTDYVAGTQLAFDTKNRPYIFNERMKEYFGTLKTLRNGEWTDIDFLTPLMSLMENTDSVNTDSVNTDSVNISSYNGYGQQSKTDTSTFIDRFALSSMHIDGDDALYLLLKLRRPAEVLNQIFGIGGQTLDNSRTARFYALLYSPDITMAMPVFQLYQITDPNATTPEEGTQHRALVEVNSGNNDRHVTPVIGLWEYKSNHPDEWAKNYDFSVYIPQKNTENDSLNLGQKILIDSNVNARGDHSGGREWAISKDGEVYVIYQDLAKDGQAKNPTYVTKINRATREVSPSVLVGHANPSNAEDSHSGPVMTMDDKGYIHVILGTHGGGLKYEKSQSPKDISGAWNVKQIPSSSTYACVGMTRMNNLFVASRKYRGGLNINKLSGNDGWNNYTLFDAESQEEQYEYSAPYHRKAIDASGNVYITYSGSFFIDGKPYPTLPVFVHVNDSLTRFTIPTKGDFLGRVVSKKVQHITFFEIADQTVSHPSVALDAYTDASGLSVSYEVDGPAKVSGETLTLTGAGTVTVRAKNAGNAMYSADEVVRSFEVFPIIRTYRLSPLEDVYSRKGSAHTNYDNEQQLIVHNNGDKENQRETFLKFDLSGIRGTVIEAKLKLMRSSGGAGVSNTNVQLHYVSDDNWTESGLTWDNRPDMDAGILSTVPGIDQTAEWDLATQVQTETVGDGILSLGLTSTTAGRHKWVGYHSKETALEEGDNRPVLVVIAAGGDPPPLLPEADFTSSVTTVNAGESVTFTDTSTESPESWSWSFPGGDPLNSTEQNPVVTYRTAGTYDVTLIATNSFGGGLKTKTGYIIVNAVLTTQNIFSTEDTYGQKGSPDTNYNDQVIIAVHNNSGKSLQREAFLGFDLSGVTGTVIEAKLKLMRLSGGVGASKTNIQLHYVSDDNWTESGLTWNNRPDMDAGILGTVSGIAETAEWDLATQVQSEINKSNDDRLSLALTSTDQGRHKWVEYYSKEVDSSENRPVLVVITSGFEQDQYSSDIPLVAPDKDLQIHPNPVDGGTLNIVSEYLIYSIEIVNYSLSQTVKELSDLNSKSIQVDTQGFPLGLYIVNCVYQDGREENARFIKQ